MNINKLYELAKSASQGEWVCSGFIVSAKDSGYVPVADTELDNESMSENASYIAASNPSAICELITAYREAVAALIRIERGTDGVTQPYKLFSSLDIKEIAKEPIDTAKRLGVE